MVEVMKGIKLPRPKVMKKRETKYPFATMAIGACFFLPDKTTDAFATYASMWGRRLKRKFSTRTVAALWNKETSAWEIVDVGTKGSTVGVGVWRVK